MFNDNIEIIKESLAKFNGTGSYFILFLIGIIYIFENEKNEKKKTLLCYFSVFALLLILNPIFNKIIDSFFNINVYWRIFWLLPLGIVLSYVATDVIIKNKYKHKQIILFLSFTVIILISGKNIYTPENYTKVNNWYKIPDEYVEVVNEIQGLPFEDKKVMTSISMVGYIRPMDSTIKLTYERRPFGDYYLYNEISYYNSGDISNLTDKCKETNTNIIVYDRNIPLWQPFEKYGYELYSQTENYDIYVSSKELSAITNEIPDVEYDEEIIPIAGIKYEYIIDFVNDLHIINNNDNLNENETINERCEIFKTYNGESSLNLWKRIQEKVNSEYNSLVVLASNIIDYASYSNITCLNDGIKNINNDVFYLRNINDYDTTLTKLSNEELDILEKKIDGNSEVYYKDLDEVLVIGLNNGINQISGEALTKLKELFNSSKPIILVTSVPFNSKVDNELERKSKEKWQGKNMTWDYSGTEYTADSNTSEFLDMLYSENNTVKAVISGNLGFKYTGKITDNITQYIFDASYKGSIGRIYLQGT